MNIYKIKYIPATELKGAKVSIKNLRENKTIRIEYDYSYNSIIDMVKTYLNGHYIKPLEVIQENEYYYLITEE